VLDDAAILARVKEIDPIVREHAAEAERGLTTAVVDALRWSGVFRMAMPAAWGGTETDICKQVEIIETVARCFPSLCVDRTFGTSITLQGKSTG
jgi:indole-3-acetate monooxygenase